MTTSKRPMTIEHLNKLKCPCGSKYPVIWYTIRFWRYFLFPILAIEILCLSCNTEELLIPCKELKKDLNDNN